MVKKNAIHNRKNWTAFSWKESKVAPLLNDVIRLQGKICGLMLAMGFSQKTEAMLNTLTLDVLKSSEIEGENLDYKQVRSSIAKRLGIDIANSVLFKANFWDKHKDTQFNSRQRLMLNKLMDGFIGKLNTSKWAKIAKCSQDTALRDIKDLLEKGILRQDTHGGRSTGYELYILPYTI